MPRGWISFTGTNRLGTSFQAILQISQPSSVWPSRMSRRILSYRTTTWRSMLALGLPCVNQSWRSFAEPVNELTNTSIPGTGQSTPMCGVGEAVHVLVAGKGQVATRVFKAQWSVCSQWAIAGQHGRLMTARGSNSWEGSSVRPAATYEALYRSTKMHADKDGQDPLVTIVEGVCPEDQKNCPNRWSVAKHIRGLLPIYLLATTPWLTIA